MGVIRTELERKARRDRRLHKKPQSEVVLPTELDEMDSPYALPEAVVLPVQEDERPDDARPRMVAMSHPEEPPTWQVEALDRQQATHPSVLSPSAFEPEDIESVRTALTPHPEEGPTPPLAKGVRAVEHSDVDTLEVDRGLKRKTRPLYPTVKPGSSS